MRLLPLPPLPPLRRASPVWAPRRWVVLEVCSVCPWRRASYSSAPSRWWCSRRPKASTTTTPTPKRPRRGADWPKAQVLPFPTKGNRSRRLPFPSMARAVRRPTPAPTPAPTAAPTAAFRSPRRPLRTAALPRRLFQKWFFLPSPKDRAPLRRRCWIIWRAFPARSPESRGWQASSATSRRARSCERRARVPAKARRSKDSC
mmetsp:Transcript_125431/g.297860  ORF Transcript_125431/g.297860 Transcript_125431/m.297860 type:complete len:202 (-) Transcript_125431:145-750(-)